MNCAFNSLEEATDPDRLDRSNYRATAFSTFGVCRDSIQQGAIALLCSLAFLPLGKIDHGLDLARWAIVHGTLLHHLFVFLSRA